MEFQPVIMAAGHGSRMTDLTTNMPKALLPIGNMPMVWYNVNMLEKAGFDSCIIIVRDNSKVEIEKTLILLQVKIKIDYVCVPSDEDWGSADSLRHIRDKVRANSDVLILSCDLITDIQLHILADIHRTYDATVTMLFATVPDGLYEQAVPGIKSKKRIEHDFIGLDSQEQRVLFMASEADFDESIPIKKSLLKKHPCLNIHTKLSDAHFYLIKRWVLDYLWEQRSITTIKGELIPHLVKKQFSKNKLPHNESDFPNPNASVISVDVTQDIYSYSKEDKICQLAKEMSSSKHKETKIGCYGYIMDSGICIRANTLATYCEANRQISRYSASLLSSDIAMVHPSASIASKSQIGNDCLVGEGVTVSERVSIKKSAIGKHCTIAEKARITNSIVMDHVNIREGSNIQNCIVCSNAEICEKCEVKDCIIGSSQQVMGKLSNEVIVDIDSMMEI